MTTVKLLLRPERAPAITQAVAISLGASGMVFSKT